LRAATRRCDEREQRRGEDCANYRWTVAAAPGSDGGVAGAVLKVTWPAKSKLLTTMRSFAVSPATGSMQNPRATTR
jgi:hypothetical protein